MAAFDLKSLVPAATIETLGGENTGKRSTKAVAIDNINKQLELIDPKKEGVRTFWDTVVGKKRSYTGKGSHVGFYIRVAGKKLKLNGDLVEAAKPKEEFKAALEGIRALIEADHYKAQLAELDAARTDRSEKANATRAARKADKGANAV